MSFLHFIFILNLIQLLVGFQTLLNHAIKILFNFCFFFIHSCCSCMNMLMKKWSSRNQRLKKKKSQNNNKTEKKLKNSCVMQKEYKWIEIYINFLIVKEATRERTNWNEFFIRFKIFKWIFYFYSFAGHCK